MHLKICLVFLVTLCFFAGMICHSAAQTVEHTKRDIMPITQEDDAVILYQETGEKMDSSEIWYSDIDGATSPGPDDGRKICSDTLEKITSDKIEWEEREQMEVNETIISMWESIVKYKQAPSLVIKPVTRKLVDTCPERRYRLYYYWEKPYSRICRVVRPRNQPVTYVRCRGSCCPSNTLLSFSRCLPGGWTRQRFLVMCYDINPTQNIKWKIVTRWFPQCCDCHKYTWTLSVKPPTK